MLFHDLARHDYALFFQAQKVQYSGPKSPNAAPAPPSKYVTTMDTQKLGTDKVFAVCYAKSGGNTNDATWADSGIRVTVPKIWNVLAASGYNGPFTTNCDIST